MSSTRELTMSEALNEALHEELDRDECVFVVGEDVAAFGGLFGVTAGLLARFGAERVIDSPISEAAITGMGVGAALVGCRPVIELQIADFLTLAMDQLVNHAAKWRYMSGGQVSVPFVLRAPVTSGTGLAAQHGQSLEAWLVHVPGLVVVMPATPEDAKGLLKSAIRDENPVVMLEKRMLYGRRGHVPTNDYVVPIGKAKVLRTGDAATVVTYAQGVHLALQAARDLERQGIEIEVIDLRTLKPLDFQTIAESIRKTGRLLVVNEAVRAGGFASEVVARVVDECWDDLDSPPVRVTGKDTPIPYAASLERRVLPQVSDVTSAVLATLGRPRPAGAPA
jgi:pyruvate/2-oxoglutarate/acetoin dehydrogenase E1 component